MRVNAKDVWDDLMDKIDLSGAYEAFVDPRAIVAMYHAIKTFPRNSLSCHIEKHFEDALKPYEYLNTFDKK
jgi:hypothetical protein